MNKNLSLQDQFAPALACFGCGPSNPLGLQIKSYVDGDKVIADFLPQPHHQAYEGMVNGGIIGALLDCHMNWTAAWHLMTKLGLDVPPCTVTASYGVEFEAPTPLDRTLRLVAWVVDSSERRVNVRATLGVDDTATAKGEGTFVSVKPGHPAYHRW
jgi:acyl-coenzyme A thioesterase PaaI-like protein